MSLNTLQYSQKKLVLESLLNKVAGMKACSFIKKTLQHSCFPGNMANFLKVPILKNIIDHCSWNKCSCLCSECMWNVFLSTLNTVLRLFLFYQEIKCSLFKYTVVGWSRCTNNTLCFFNSQLSGKGISFKFNYFRSFS